MAGDNGVKPVIWIFEFGTAHLAYQLKQAARDKHPSRLWRLGIRTEAKPVLQLMSCKIHIA